MVIESTIYFLNIEINERNINIAIVAKDATLEFKKTTEAQRTIIELKVLKIKAQAKLTMAEKKKI